MPLITPAGAALDNLSEPALMLALELRRLGVGLTADRRIAGEDARKIDTLAATKHCIIRRMLRSAQPSLFCAGGRLYVGNAGKLSLRQWRKLHAHRDELFHLLTGGT